MLKLKHQLTHSINLGIDFLLRHIQEDGSIEHTNSLYDHLTASMCLSENPRNQEDKVKLTLGKISQFSYSHKGRFFVYDNDQSLTKWNAIAGLAFAFIGKSNWAIRYLRTISDRQEGGFIAYDDKGTSSFDHSHMGQTVRLFVHLNSLTPNERFLLLVEECRKWIVKNGSKSNYWNSIGLSYQNENMTDEVKKWIGAAAESNPNDLDILTNSLTYDEHWKTRIEMLCHERLKQQVPPSDRWRAGAFCDAENRIRIDWSEKYISTFKRLLPIINRLV